VNSAIYKIYIQLLLAFLVLCIFTTTSSAQEDGFVTKAERTLTLNECIDIAMKNHLPLEIAEKQLKLAQFRLLEAERELAPSVTARWEESRGRVTSRFYTGTKILVEGKQPIFYGGELIYSVQQAKVNLQVVKKDYERIKNDLIFQVKKAYYSLDKAKKVVTIQARLKEQITKFYNIAKTAYEAEAIAQVEFLKLTSQYNQIMFQFTSAEGDLSVANLLLQHVMNIDKEIEIAPVEEPVVIKLDLEDCYSLAYLNRPEIKISQLALEYFKYEEKIMKSRTDWPRVDLLGSYGNTREDFVKDDLIGGQDPRGLGPEYYIGTKVSLPIWGSTLGYAYTKEKWQPVVSAFHGTEATTHSTTFSLFDKLGDISQVKEAELEYMKSLNENNKTKQDITLEVKEAFFQYKKAILLMDLAKSKVEYQSRQVEILDIQRQLGELQYSNVVEEMIRLAEEEFSYAQAISDYYVSIASLNKAIGIDDYFGEPN